MKRENYTERIAKIEKATLYDGKKFITNNKLMHVNGMKTNRHI